MVSVVCLAFVLRLQSPDPLIDWTTQTFMNDMIWQKNNSCDSHIDCYDNIARVVTVSQ